jgi:hypothetical protein
VSDPAVRLLVVAVLVALVAAASWAYRRRSAADAARGAAEGEWPDLPAELAGGPPGTWVVFSTPMCVTCTTVQADLERAFPGHRVVKVDATQRPDLADRYAVRRAPTVIRATPSGQVRNRLVGLEGVRAHLAGAGATA